jgi:hypothetical protein
MHVTAPLPNPTSVIEVDAPVTNCVVEGCGGAVVRHSLGGAQAVHRCTRCFRRYQLRSLSPPESREPGVLRRFLADFVSWRDE